MDIKIEPRLLSGSVTPPASKSSLIRAILCAALAEGESVIGGVSLCDDVCAALDAATRLGASVERNGETITIRGIGGVFERGECPSFDCGESAAVLRFLIPVALVLCGGGRFVGHGRLMSRPMTPYLRLFDEYGIRYTRDENALTLRGSLRPGRYALPGDVSSQFFSGLLLGLALCPAPSEIVSLTPVQSLPYIEMTMDSMSRFGASTSRDGDSFFVSGGGYTGARVSTEADWSNGAFWVAARFLGGDIRINGLDDRSAQGDRVIVEMADALSRPGHAAFDLSMCPDLLPPAAVMAAVRQGDCLFTGCERLRYKESDRLCSVRELLSALGAEVSETADGLFIRGRDGLTGGVSLDCRSDHRIAMMAAVAAMRCREPVIIKNAEAVNKSYPDFFARYNSLGGAAYAL